MWTIIRKYYLATFVGFFVVSLTKGFLTQTPTPFFKNLIIALITAFSIGLIAGTLYYFLDTKWGPNKRRKMFSKRPFSDFFMNGFKQKDDAAVGVINGYTVILNYTWPNGASAIAVHVLYDKNVSERYKSSIDDMKKRHKFKEKGFIPQQYIWKEGVIGWLLSYSFNPPTYEKVLATAEAMILALKAEGLPPVGYEDKDKPKLAAGEVVSFGFAG